MQPARTLDNGSLTGAVLSRRWRVGRKIGEGGMAEVYVADPIDGGTQVAVKIVRAEYLEDRAVLERFLEEARVSARLIHPNIVRVHECAAAEDGSPYLVMELLQGVPLGAYTQGGGRVHPAQAVPILHGILAGLAAAHAQNVVHRDLKPENVFLTRDAGGAFVVKVLDFGIAKVMDEAGGMGSRTRTGMLLGTPAFMSPEQVKSARQVDARTDLWSAGVLFYEMLTGREAFAAETEFARLTAVMTGEPTPVDQVDPALAPFAPFLARALRKNRDERFQSALEMARALQAIAPQALETSRNRFSELPRTLGSQLATQDHPPRRPSGTLSSPAPAQQPVESPAQVVLLEPQSTGGTLPSRGLPIIRAGRGVAGLVVIFLVVASLAVGFLLGFAVGRAS
jgi:serine/threonine-protein kinase